MSIVLDAVSSGGVGDNTGSLSWSHTCTGSNLILVVGVGLRDPVDVNCGVTSITYGGRNLTKIRHDKYNSGIQTVRSELWYLVAPPTGSNTIVATFISAATDDSGAGAISLNGVHQIFPLEGNTGSATGAQASPLSTSITTLGPERWVIDASYSKADIDFSPETGQTAYVDINPRAGGDNMGGSYKGPNSAGSVTMQWNYPTGNDDYAQSLVSLRPASINKPFINSLRPRLFGPGLAR